MGIQRKYQILQQRLKIPPVLNQFTHTLDRHTATQLFRLLDKYRPETKQARKARLRARAQAKVAEKDEGEANKEAQRGEARSEDCGAAYRAEESSTGPHCSRCRAHRAGPSSPCSVS